MKHLPLALLAALLALTASPVHAQVIKMATVVPEGSPWHDTLLDISRRWKALSNGRVTLRIYAGGVAGDEEDMLRKIRVGQLHAAGVTSTSFLSAVPDIEVLTYPLLLRTNDELKQVIEVMSPAFEQALEEKGFKVLSWNHAGWVRFFSKKPVVTPEDMRERKLFFWGSDPTYTELLKRSGFHPVPLAVTDLLPSLQTGLVDTFGAPPTAALSFQWFGLAKHMTELKWQPLPSLTVMSMRQWKRIPAEFHEPMLAAAREAGRDLERKVVALEQDAIQAMKSYGLEVHEVPPEARRAWEALVEQEGKPVLVGPRIAPAVYEKVESALAAFRAAGQGALP